MCTYFQHFRTFLLFQLIIDTRLTDNTTFHEHHKTISERGLLKLAISHQRLVSRFSVKPLLLFIYINDIDDRMEGQIIKFADDTKLNRTIKSEQDDEDLQKDIVNIEQWSRKLR